ncbi:poly-gamma-glutamate biosynthesis protein PgsC/CapC [Kangiella marina]|uniref:Capsule biosynthesis CapC n=1 Tax=Kangiella marina TaxID=1079178 RepID=A0ABP8IAS7_9GAMM
MLESLFPLNLFPEGSLSSSLVITVWIGVLVVAFFNLRFGWVLSGLVVPGYLVPLLIVKPVSFWVVIFEAIVTYILSRYISDRLTIQLKLSHFFGRDRFFLIILVSVIVRLIFDSTLFPYLSAEISEYTGEPLSIQNDLHSFGLIVIALLANQMWKTGLVRGIFHALTGITITYFIITVVLVNLTNFNVENLSFMYEEISLAILSSPKSYIILLVCAYIASRMNLLYGWEYSGILIPSLLALQWYDPQKILVTFLETFIILGIAVFTMKLPFFANKNFLGAKKIVLFFTIGILYKFALAYYLQWLSPYTKTSDYFAFGYLLSTLIAIKMHDKEYVIHISRATLQTSLTAIILATFIGYSLTFAKINYIEQSDSEQIIIEPHPIENFSSWFNEKKLQFYEVKSEDYVVQPTPKELFLFSDVINQLSRLDNPEQISDEMLISINDFGYRIATYKDYVFLYPARDVSRGMFALNYNPQAQHIILSSPRGIDERLSFDSIFSLFELTNVKYLAISSNPHAVNGDGSSDDLLSSSTFFNQFHNALNKRAILQLRTSTTSDLLLTARKFDDTVTSAGNSYMWVRGDIPVGLNFHRLSELLNSPKVLWKSPQFKNQQRRMSDVPFIELLIDRRVASKLNVLASHNLADVETLDTNLSIKSYLFEELYSNKLAISRRNSESYRVPKEYELNFFYDEILEPVKPLLEKAKSDWTESDFLALQKLNSLASIFNYQYTLYEYDRQNKEYLILSEIDNDERQKHWGLYVFALNSDSDDVIEVPRPLLELGTYEYGVSLFDTSNARALLIAGAHSFTNTDGSSNLLSIQNPTHLFGIVHYLLFNEETLSYRVAHLIRTFNRDQHDISNDVVITEDSNTLQINESQEVRQRLQSMLTGLSIEFSSTDNIQLMFSGNSLTNQLRYHANKSIFTHWISPSLFLSLRLNKSLWWLRKHFQLLEFTYQEGDIAQYFESQELSSERFPAAAKRNLESYLETENIAYLIKVKQRDEYRYSLFLDQPTNQMFLLIKRDNQLVAVRNVNSINDIEIDRTDFSTFLDLRATWLEAPR